MQTLNIDKTIQAVTGFLLLALMSGCAEWNSVPVVVDQNFGRAYHNMVKNQTLYPEHSQAVNATLGLDGQKAQTVINAYRAPTSERLEDAKKGVKFDVGNVGGTSN
jgi:hypothetical protein